MPWASYQIRKIASCACAGNAGNVFPRGHLQRKPIVSDPGMHHGTCVTHVPWCMSGSLTRGGGENVPGIPGASAILRIWLPASPSHQQPCDWVWGKSFNYRAKRVSRKHSKCECIWFLHEINTSTVVVEGDLVGWWWGGIPFLRRHLRPPF